MLASFRIEKYINDNGQIGRILNRFNARLHGEALNAGNCNCMCIIYPKVL